MFKTIGAALLQGRTLYADIFDNKGPLLYFINALGIWIGGERWGIFMLQVIGMSSSIYLLFRIVRRFSSRVVAAASTMFALLVNAAFMQEGNQCEEWELYCMVPMLFAAIKWIDNQAVDCSAWSIRKLALIVGFSTGCIAMIRPNDAASLGGGIAIGIGAWMVSHHKWRELLRAAVWGALGASIALIPFLIYFAAKGALSDFWFGIIGINIPYSGGVKGMLIGLISDSAKTSIFAVIIGALIMIWLNKRIRHWLYLFGPIGILVVMTMGNSLFRHYYIILLPLWVVMSASLHNTHKPTALLALAVLLLTPQTTENRSVIKMAYQSIKTNIRIGPYQKIFSKENYYTFANHQYEVLLQPVPHSQRDSIWNYNCGQGDHYQHIAIFTHNHIVPCNKVLYDFGHNNGIPIPGARQILVEGCFPLWVVVAGYSDEDICSNGNYLKHYQLMATNRLGHALYRRRDAKAIEADL